MDGYRRKTLDRTLPFSKGGVFASFGCMTYIPKRPEVHHVISPWTIPSQQEHLYKLPGKHTLNYSSVCAFVTLRRSYAVSNPSYLLQPEPIVS